MKDNKNIVDISHRKQSLKSRYLKILTFKHIFLSYPKKHKKCLSFKINKHTYLNFYDSFGTRVKKIVNEEFVKSKVLLSNEYSLTASAIYLSNDIRGTIKRKHILFFIVNKKESEIYDHIVNDFIYCKINYANGFLLYIVNQFDLDKNNEILKILDGIENEYFSRSFSDHKHRLLIRISALQNRPLLVEKKYSIHYPRLEKKNKHSDENLFNQFVDDFYNLFSTDFIIKHMENLPRIRVKTSNDFCFNENLLKKEVDLRNYNYLLDENEEATIENIMDEIELIF